MLPEIPTYIREEWTSFKTNLHQYATEQFEANVAELRTMKKGGVGNIEAGLAILRTDIQIEFLVFTALLAGVQSQDLYDKYQARLNETLKRGGYLE
jgi:hypothetical protein